MLKKKKKEKDTCQFQEERMKEPERRRGKG
jgi:hypothetical protein